MPKNTKSVATGFMGALVARRLGESPLAGEVAETSPATAADDEVAHLHAEVREGLPYQVVEELASRYELDRGELAEVLDLSPRTLNRRSRQGRLRPAESDRLFRVLDAALLATRVLGSYGRAAEWLHRANRALGGKTPLSRLRTTIGTRQVEQVLGRIDHGVYG